MPVPTSLTGIGFNTIDARTRKPISANVQLLSPWPQPDGVGLNARGATETLGPDIDSDNPATSTNIPGFYFGNAGEGHGRIILSKRGYKTLTIDGPLPPQPANLTYALEPEAIGPITTDGRDLFRAGAPYVVAGTDGQRDFEFWMKGRRDELKAAWHQAAALGSTSRLVWGMFDLGFQTPDNAVFHPQDWAHYYDELVPFGEAMAAESGQHVIFVHFVNTQTVMPNAGDQLQYFLRCDPALVELNRRFGAMAILVNEGSQHDNYVDPRLFPVPLRYVAASGSEGAGQDPPELKWTCSALHPERTKPGFGCSTLFFAIHGYAGENGNPGYAGTQQATFASEPIGFDVVTIPGRRTNDPRVAYDEGSGCRMGHGGIAHSTQGLQSQVLPAPVDACVEKFLRGVKGLPYAD